jgi:hypothetical protein
VHLLITALAIDIDNERRAAAARHSIARSVRAAAGPPRSPVRRHLALGLAAVSRSSAGAVRRLDACLADDLAAGLASSAR